MLYSKFTSTCSVSGVHRAPIGAYVMHYQTTIAISKFGSFISESFLYAPPTRFEPMLFGTFYLQVLYQLADRSTGTSKPLLISNNNKWNFIQLSVIEMFREVISACWATSLNCYGGMHVRNSLKMKNVVKISYCQCIPEILDQLTSSRSIFVLMGFLVVDISLMHLDI